MESTTTLWSRLHGTKESVYLRKCYNRSRQLFFLFIGREPTTWPAKNCLQIMVCLCAISSSNCVWLQIIFCSCVNETTLFSFLRSLLSKNGRWLPFYEFIHWKETRIRMIKQCWTRLSQNIVIFHCLAGQLLRETIDVLATDKSRYFAQPRRKIVSYHEVAQETGSKFVAEKVP